jgi:hypothetical protein
VIDALKSSEKNIIAKIQKLQVAMFRRVDGVDLNTRHLLKYQFNAIFKIQRKLRLLNKKISEQDERHCEGEKTDSHRKDHFNQEDIEAKKKDLVKQINK